MMFLRVIDCSDTCMRIYMRVRAWISPTTIGTTRFGSRMYCDTRDFIQRRIFYFGVYEPNLTNYLAERLGIGDTFVDVGANVGYITLLGSYLVGDHGKVISIEAVPATFECLSRNIALNEINNVSTLNKAATSAPCMVEIVPGEPRNSGSNSIRPTSASTSALVAGDTLSQLIDKVRHEVTCIKIDVEGSEMPILEDLLAHIDQYKKLLSVVVELSNTTAEIIPRFIAAGFRCYGLPNNYRIGYFLVRQYLARSNEDNFVVKLRVSQYDSRFTDYVFEREQVNQYVGEEMSFQSKGTGEIVTARAPN